MPYTNSFSSIQLKQAKMVYCTHWQNDFTDSSLDLNALISHGQVTMVTAIHRVMTFVMWSFHCSPLKVFLLVCIFTVLLFVMIIMLGCLIVFAVLTAVSYIFPKKKSEHSTSTTSTIRFCFKVHCKNLNYSNIILFPAFLWLVDWILNYFGPWR